MKYVCPVCGYVYDEEKQGKLFADLPDSWVCPVCKAPKSVFTAQEEKKETLKEEVSEPVELNEDLTELTKEQLSALFSNLQRGCEKQYHQKEADMFGELASYFENIQDKVEESTVEELSSRILKDLNERYPRFEDASNAVSDRGALRVYTWGSKVTRMQQAIIERYKREGDEFLAHTNIWVCSVCGFIYVGDNPPELCPVCKVPSWKFEKMEGGKRA